MPGWATDVAGRPELAGLAVCIAVALVLGVIGVRRYLKNRPTAADLERRRRQHLILTGKMGDGEIIDVEGATLVYSYHVAGVEYTAGQDVSALQSLLPGDLMSMVGPASVKFDPRNPANSIVLAETWSGLRIIGTHSGHA